MYSGESAPHWRLDLAMTHVGARDHAARLMEPLGLDRGTVVVAGYDRRWRALFDDVREELTTALGPSILEVHHIGSTAVPGLCAKPILDVLVSVPDFSRAVELVPRLASLQFEFRRDEEIPDRHYFRRPPGGAIRTHHLSMAEPTSRYHIVTIGFRDALRNNPELAAEYGRLKLGLAERYPRDRQAYIEGKTEFVTTVLASVGLR
jgi:GrpB-like predicted nucleotidyltransferase (UPF0157 family)